jgi:DNA-binding NarL/FixJ family response regulator
MRIRILIADDHEFIRKGVRRLIEVSGHTNWEICGEAADGSEAVARAKQLKPDLMIADIAMPRATGFDAAQRLSEAGDSCRVLLISMYESRWLIEEARRVGAQGYVSKFQAARDLIPAMERLLAGGTFFRPAETLA